MKTPELIEVAFDCHRAGEFGKAEALYRLVLDDDANDLNALQLLGALVGDLGRADEAIGLLERAANAVLARGGESAQHAVLHYNLGRALGAAGRHAEAIARYRHCLALAPDLADPHAALGAEFLIAGDPAEAATAFAAALRLAPARADWRHDFGTVLAAMGRVPEGIAQYRAALTLAPGQAATLRALGTTLFNENRPDEALEILRRADDADSWTLIGRIEHAAGNIDAAEDAYRRAISSEIGHVEALFRLGLLLHGESNQSEAALALYRRVRALAPNHVEVFFAIGIACRALARIDQAIAAFGEYLARRPESAAAHFQLGLTLAAAGQHGEAISLLEYAIGVDTAGSVSHLAHILRGMSLQHLGSIDAALREFRLALAHDQVAELMPVISARAPKKFEALVVIAPGFHNTPYDYLLEQDFYRANFVLLVEDFDYDVTALRSRGEVVINLVSDADQDRKILPRAAHLIDRLGLPVVNHPGKILWSDRESIAARIRKIPNCRVASVSRQTPAALSSPDFWARPEIPALPFLARRAGGHNGDDFEKIATPADFSALLSRSPDADHYLIAYIDYRSPDGYFRKYRFFFVGPEILPYHLAIGADWKVHHVNTEMARHAWMRAEEEAFLRAPETIFRPRQMAALRAVQVAVGLEFFGIDCALDRDGNVVVFEANATMRVHADNPGLPYRTPFVHPIRDAFNTMVAGMRRK